MCERGMEAICMVGGKREAVKKGDASWKALYQKYLKLRLLELSKSSHITLMHHQKHRSFISTPRLSIQFEALSTQ